jgi:membrane-associated protease RseP (regulator of RpoE activity)
MLARRRGLTTVVLIGSLLVCAWCSLISAVGGWVLGNDMGQREARMVRSGATPTETLPPLGVLVTRVDRSGPAALAGIARGDIIVAINGTLVQDARDLREQLQNYPVGDTVRLTFLRNNAQTNVSVLIGTYPNEQNRPYIGIYFTARGEEPADL